MRAKRVAVAGFALLVAGTPLAAQQPGMVEIGTFGKFTRLDRRGEFDDALSLSGRLGVFILPQISLEVDAARGRVEDPQGTRTNFTPFHARLLYNRPLGVRTDLVLGAGYAQYDYGKTDEVPADEYGVGMLAGLRFGLSERVAFRLDGTVDVMPVTWNANRGVAVRQPDGRYVAKFRGRTHVGLQAGLGVFWNPRQQRVTSPIPIPAEPAPSPAPPATEPEPQPTPQPAPAAPAARAAEPAEPVAPAGPTAEEVARARALLEEAVYFDFDQSTIRPDAAGALERKAEVLKANAGVVLRIEGHADERGSTEYNLALGLRRANAVKDQLVRLGVPASQLETVSLGESRPVDARSNEEAWSRNRRAEFQVVRGGEALRLPPR